VADLTPRVVIVGCGASKLACAAPARDLYTGPLFKAARADVEARGLPWAIASAKHGFVLPETVLEPYDMTIAQRKKEDRRLYPSSPWNVGEGWPSFFRDNLLSWLYFGFRPNETGLFPPFIDPKRRHERFAPRTFTPVEVEIHAGRAYVEAIRSGFENIAPAARAEHRDHWAAGLVTIVEPARGLEIGERLAFYAQRRTLARAA
jgi:hypothetical protein